MYHDQKNIDVIRKKHREGQVRRFFLGGLAVMVAALVVVLPLIGWSQPVTPTNGASNPISGTTGTFSTSVGSPIGNFTYVDGGIGRFATSVGVAQGGKICLNDPACSMWIEYNGTDMRFMLSSGEYMKINNASGKLTHTYPISTNSATTSYEYVGTDGQYFLKKAGASTGLWQNAGAAQILLDVAGVTVATFQSSGAISLGASSGSFSHAGAGNFSTASANGLVMTGNSAGIYINNAAATANYWQSGMSAANMSSTVAAIRLQTTNAADADDLKFAVQAGVAGAGGNVFTVDEEGDTQATSYNGMRIVRLAADQAIDDNASYDTIFSYTPPASKNINIYYSVSVIPSATTVGVQLRVSSADTGYVGNCVFTTYGISGTAASATAIESDIIAIAAAPADTAAAAACAAAAPCLIDVTCTLTSDASPGAILLEGQLETGTTNAPAKAGATYYTVTTN